MSRWALNPEWGTKEVSGEESPDGANKVSTSPMAFLSAEEAGQTRSSRGGRVWPDKELCLPSRVVSPFRVSEPHFLENGPEVSTGTLPRGSPAGKPGTGVVM